MSAFIPPEWTECNIDDTNWFRTVTTIGSLLLTVRTCRRSKVRFQIEPSDGSLTIQHMPLNCSVLAYICHVCPLLVDSDIITLWNGQGLFQLFFCLFLFVLWRQDSFSGASLLLRYLYYDWWINSTFLQLQRSRDLHRQRLVNFVNSSSQKWNESARAYMPLFLPVLPAPEK